MKIVKTTNYENIVEPFRRCLEYTSKEASRNCASCDNPLKDSELNNDTGLCGLCENKQNIANFNSKIKEASIIDKRTKNQILTELNSKGLDGNGRFLESDSGISIIWEVLGKFGYAISEVVSKDLFLGDSGRRSLRIERKSTSENPFDPGEEIENSMIAYTWYQREPNNFEILVYLS